MKNEFEKAEVEVIIFSEKDDIVTQSTVQSGGWGGEQGQDLGDL